MSRFVTGLANLVKEESCMTMLYDDMTLAILMVYDQSIEESNLCRISRNMKRSGSTDQSQLGSRRGLKLKMDVVLLKSTLRRVVVLKVVTLLVLLVERTIMGSV